MLSNPSQLILRNSELFESKNVLLLNFESDLLAKELLHSAKQVTALALDFNHYQQLASHESASLSVYFGHNLPVEAKFDAVILFYPKSKSLAPYLINLAGLHLKSGGELFVVGENKGGVRSIAKQLPDYFDSASKLDNARHCLLFGTELINTAPAIKLEDWVSQYTLSTPQGEITICNLVGVFSEKRLDEGTKLLLEHLPALHGKVLDFGCGAGIISAAMLKLQPTLDIDCVDINAMALASCRLTLAANGMTANVYPSDGIGQAQGVFDGIISNPPFHDGLQSTTNIAAQFVQDSAKKLKPSGKWRIVANRHLPYSELIAKQFKTVNVIAENNKYKVYSNS
ncbi:methyltransferase [Shewanella mesophila]|uniref:methyltransferase n=1 Tax=Shewanella mesophila TaxID=2864208 RepID=UPI001C65FB33|nr:methyltransferase [Shewanella mesophila]QYJ85726.1 methyltransferase [Shewanella mesophila]